MSYMYMNKIQRTRLSLWKFWMHCTFDFQCVSTSVIDSNLSLGFDFVGAFLTSSGSYSIQKQGNIDNVILF